MPGGASISICGASSDTSISTSLSSSLPSRSILRNFCRVAESVGCMFWMLTSRAGGSSTSSRRSSATSAARSRTLRASASRVCLIAASARSRMIVSTSRPTYPTSVNFVASTLMNGASASRASRRAISVLPTPVGPIMRMFLGVISWRSGSATCMRRQRLRSAMATARLAASWPTMCLSSSCTICRGVSDDMRLSSGALAQLLDENVAIGVDADVGSDVERALDDAARVELGALEQRARGRERVLAAGADRSHIVLGLDHIAVARDQEEFLRVPDQQQRLEAPQIAIGAPVLGELDRGTCHVAVLLELSLEALEQREGIRGAAREAREHLAVGETAHLACVALHDGIPEGDLAVTAEGDRAVTAHAENSRTVWIKRESVVHG